MNKKAFTLIELLAVIIIIGVIAVITIPKVKDSLDNSKKNVAKTSAYGYKKAIKEFVLTQEMNKNKIKLDGEYDIDIDGNIYNEEEYYSLEYDGKKPKNGILIYEGNELTYGCITIDKYRANIEDGEVISIEKGTCEYEKMYTPAELQRQEDLKTLAASYITSLQQSEYEGSGIVELSDLRSYVNYNMEPPSSGWISLLYNETNGITIFEYSLKYGTNEVVTFNGEEQALSASLASKPAIAVLSGVDGKTIGDEIAIGTEHFYVLSYDNSTNKTTALAKANLNVGKYVNSNFTEGLQGEVGTNYGVILYTSCYFLDESASPYLKSQYRIGTTSDANIYDPENYAGEPGTSNYSLAYYVVNYKQYFERKYNDINVSARLLTKSEYATYKSSLQTILQSQRFALGTGKVSYSSSSNTYTCWVYMKDTSSTTSASNLASVNTTTTPGVRPVIEFSKVNRR